MTSPLFIYYIGGPWDQHKVSRAELPDRGLPEIIRVPMVKKRTANGAQGGYVDHEYDVQRVADFTYIALYRGERNG